MVDKPFHAVLAIARDQQVSDEVDADAFPTGIGFKMWLYKADGFPVPVIRLMAQVTPCNVSMGMVEHVL
jgi:hypothetical protein